MWQSYCAVRPWVANALIREHGQGRHHRPALARQVDQRRALRDELFAPAAVTVVLSTAIACAGRMNACEEGRESKQLDHVAKLTTTAAMRSAPSARAAASGDGRRRGTIIGGGRTHLTSGYFMILIAGRFDPSRSIFRKCATFAASGRPSSPRSCDAGGHQRLACRPRE